MQMLLRCPNTFSLQTLRDILCYNSPEISNLRAAAHPVLGVSDLLPQAHPRCKEPLSEGPVRGGLFGFYDLIKPKGVLVIPAIQVTDWREGLHFQCVVLDPRSVSEEESTEHSPYSS